MPPKSAQKKQVASASTSTSTSTSAPEPTAAESLSIPTVVDISPHTGSWMMQNSSLGLRRLYPKIVTQVANSKAEAPKPKRELAELPIIENFIAWVNYELKHLIKLDPRPLASLYTLPNNINRWTVEDVNLFLSILGFDYTAELLYRNNMDGPSLLLLRRVDVLHGLGLRIGPAMKLYAYIERLRQDFKIDLGPDD